MTNRTKNKKSVEININLEINNYLILDLIKLYTQLEIDLFSFLANSSILSFSFLLTITCSLIESFPSGIIVTVTSPIYILFSLRFITFKYIGYITYINHSNYRKTKMTTATTLIGLLVMAILAIFFYIYKNRCESLDKELKELKSQLKSQQVKFGKSFEHFVPFMDNFPADREKTIFLGMPIDFIAFDENSVKFIEVKTGESQLNQNQKRIKKLIEDKQVEWHELRYG